MKSPRELSRWSSLQMRRGNISLGAPVAIWYFGVDFAGEVSTREKNAEVVNIWRELKPQAQVSSIRAQVNTGRMDSASARSST